MLSIIICSRSTALASSLAKNIDATIGIEYELIILDNAVSKIPIAIQYNNGGEKAKYNNLLFIHEDIAFITNNWGKILSDLLSKDEIGIVGVAGSKYYPDCPGTWPNDRKFIRENVYFNESRFLENPENEKFSEVVTLDGVFLACRKEVWAENKFNEGLTGFHFYDLDFSFRILTATELKLIVTYDIVINHFSLGKLNMDWIDQSIIFYEQWKKQLPLTVIAITNEEKTPVLKNKLEEFIMLFYFNYDGRKRGWLISFYARYANILKTSKGFKFAVRYLLFGPSNSAMNKKIERFKKKIGNYV